MRCVARVARWRRVVLAGVVALAVLVPGASRAEPAQGETLGFVVSAYDWGFPRGEHGHCPRGTNVSEAEYFKVDMKRFRADVKVLGWVAANAKHFPPDACRDPNAQPDPGFRTFDALDVPVDGLDLDGTASGKADARSCAHNAFQRPDGRRGIDNQQWRLLGCTTGFQTFISEKRDGRVGRQKQGEMLVTEDDYPILIEVSGVDDRNDDDDVRVRFLSSAQPIALDANGDVVPWTSLTVYRDAKYWSAPARGKIVQGVLTTEPIDLKLRFRQQVLDGELWWRDARLEARVNGEGRLEGLLGFYWDADNWFRIHNDHHIGEHHTGRLLALARGYMCAGMYHALGRLADGHRDAATGKCTSLSSALRFQATPAFVITDPG
jgi:hypothetical protein